MSKLKLCNCILAIGKQSFSKDICRSMVAMLDFDGSGKLNIDELQSLINNIAKWRMVFETYDRDNSGKLNTYELRGALESSGFRVNNHILIALVHRYGTKSGLIEFDDFVVCAIKLRTINGNYAHVSAHKH